MANDWRVKGNHVLLIAHAVEGVEEDQIVIRVISARKATRRERDIYAQAH